MNEENFAWIDWINWIFSEQQHICAPCCVGGAARRVLGSLGLSLGGAIDMAQNRPLWRMMSTFGAMQS